MSTRADTITQLQKIPDLFSDFLTDFTPHPITKDVVRVKNDVAIKKSVRNIVLTITGERFFSPYLGGSIKKALFDMNDIIMEEELRYKINLAITRSEPRAQIIDIQFVRDEQRNYLNVSIFFLILNSQVIQSVDLILRRIR